VRLAEYFKATIELAFLGRRLGARGDGLRSADKQAADSGDQKDRTPSG
jgi:hypothetical protein